MDSTHDRAIDSSICAWSATARRPCAAPATRYASPPRALANDARASRVVRADAISPWAAACRLPGDRI